jgi:PAS domain S-box-containing protein
MLGLQVASIRSSALRVLKVVAEGPERIWNALVVRTRSRVVRDQKMLQKARRAREYSLQRLLADSLDAVVVINDERQFMTANSAALALFGISAKNIVNFTIDAFLPGPNMSNFERTGPPFLRGKERRGKCEIRRLDGSRRIAEFSFQANFVPGRHLSRFRLVNCDRSQT